MHPAIVALAAIGGGFTVASYIYLWCTIGDEGSKWLGPIPRSAVPAWVAYTLTTVAAYFAVNYWLLFVAVPDSPLLYWLVAAFNFSASAWVFATRHDYVHGTQYGWASVWLTGALSAVWAVAAQRYSPGLYNVGFAAIVFHHVVFDAIVWGNDHLSRDWGTMSPQNRRLRVQHIVSATLHLASTLTFVLVIYSSFKKTLDDYNWPISQSPASWRRICMDADDEQCTDRRFYIEADSNLTIPVAWYTAAFALWSGLMHLVFLLRMHPTDDNTQLGVIVRGVDYSVSASLMFAVINALFGLATPFGVFLGPALMGLCIAVSGMAELAHVEGLTDAGRLPLLHWAPVVATLVYCWLWGMTFATAVDATQPSDDPDEGVAPKAIVVALAVLCAIFSSFGVIYFVSRYRTNSWRDTANSMASIVAKVTLHSFVALSIVNQSNMVAYSAETAAELADPSDLTPGTSFGIAFGAVAVVSIIFAIIHRATRYTTQG